SVSPKPGVEFSQIELAIDGVIADVIQNPARAEDLERVKTQLIAEAIYAQDNQATLARWYGGALTTGLSIDDIRSWPDRIRAVTAEQVRDAAQDPAAKSGVGNMVAGLLDEGSGDLDSKTFHERLERRAIELSFSSTRDYFRGSLRMLKDNKDEAFDLLHLALTSPHFDATDV